MSGIDALIPQSGAMVLLDRVVSHDATSIVCSARSHHDAANPLAHHGVLPIWAGIEYAAQAMAAHFALGTGVPGEGAIGLLGALRDVVCAVDRLDDIESPLVVTARRLSHDPAGSIYAFSVQTEGDGRELLRGRATVVQRARLA